MKKYLLSIFCALILIKVDGQYVVIPDTNFLNKIFTVAPSAVSGNMIDTTDFNLISIENLVLNGSNISDLSGIEYFDGLTHLSCDINNLTAIPSLFPPLLTFLNLSNNPISEINRLPESLDAFACVQCNTTVIDSLPHHLTQILLGVNQIARLPSLPPSLVILDCSDNLLDSLPQLPNDLSVLVITRNLLYCLPILPISLNQLYAGGTHISCIPNHPPNFNLSDIGFTICDSTNTTCPLLLSAISEVGNYLMSDIFPNPTVNTFNMKNISSNEISLLQIINPIGKIVYTEKLFGKNEYTIDANLTKGIYFVRISNYDKDVVRKIVIN